LLTVSLSHLSAECRTLEGGNRRHREADLTGLILLLLIGALVAFGWTRLRGKMKLGVSGKNWIGPIVIVVVLVLMLWAAHNGH
jgi:fumarate reductase subunit D